MNFHPIDIPGDYSGTVEVSKCTLQLKCSALGSYSFTTELGLYHFWLLTPDRKNIEFHLLRFPDGEWCDNKYMYPLTQRNMDPTLILQVKEKVFRLGL